MRNNLKVAVITPLTEGMLHRQYHRSVLALQKPKNVNELIIRCPDAMEIDVALNSSIIKALGMKVDYIFLWEADMNIPQETLQYLVEDNKDVVSGLYFQKVYPHMPVLYNYINHPTSKYIMSCFYYYDDGDPKKGLRQVDVVGAGCALIKADVFRKIEPPYFRFLKEDPAVKDGGSISADNYFCRKLKDAGVSVFVDTRICCGHIYVGEACEADWVRNRKQYIEDVTSGKIKLEFEIPPEYKEGESRA